MIGCGCDACEGANCGLSPTSLYPEIDESEGAETVFSRDDRAPHVALSTPETAATGGAYTAISQSSHHLPKAGDRAECFPIGFYFRVGGVWRGGPRLEQGKALYTSTGCDSTGFNLPRQACHGLFRDLRSGVPRSHSLAYVEIQTALSRPLGDELSRPTYSF